MTLMRRVDYINLRDDSEFTFFVDDEGEVRLPLAILDTLMALSDHVRAF